MGAFRLSDGHGRERTCLATLGYPQSTADRIAETPLLASPRQRRAPSPLNGERAGVRGENNRDVHCRPSRSRTDDDARGTVNCDRLRDPPTTCKRTDRANPPRFCVLLSLWLVLASFAASGQAGAGPVDVISEDASRFTQLLRSPAAERRIEGIQGLSHLKHWPVEDELLRLLDDKSPLVRREAVLALCRLGTAKSVPRLIVLLGDRSWEVRQNAWLGLCHMTAQNFPAEQKTQWEQWWQSGTATDKAQALLAAAQRGSDAAKRSDALRALRHLATASDEEALLALLRKPPPPPLSPDERTFLCEALERIGTAKAIPTLAAQQTDAAAWALGHIGGSEAEQALLKFRPTLSVLLALDRLHSTNCAPLIPHLVGQMGLVTYRGQPDDVMNEDLQPIQRVGANLIRRSGQAPLLIELVLQELEDTMKPPIAHGPRPACPTEWSEMLKRMHSELKPGFVREDGATTSQPIAALCYTADDPALAKRLIPLLRHPAYVPRIYVALTLGRLHATEALTEIVDLIREGYWFSDSTALASGKHFEQSQTVRWRGFLCMALGRMGGDEARAALESLAADPKQPRDIRYSSVVGLGFIASPKSLPVLRKVAGDDVIWMVRDEARRVMESIELLGSETAVADQEAAK